MHTDKNAKKETSENDQNEDAHSPTGSNTIKDPKEWTTGDEPMTGAQRSYLHTLAEGTHGKIDDTMSKAQAARKIEELHKTHGNQKTNVNESGNADNTVKDPNDWKTGSEPMTGAQRSYLRTLSDEAGEEVDEKMTKAAASKRIDELQQKTGRGLQNK